MSLPLDLEKNTVKLISPGLPSPLPAGSADHGGASRGAARSVHPASRAAGRRREHHPPQSTPAPPHGATCRKRRADQRRPGARGRDSLTGARGQGPAVGGARPEALGARGQGAGRTCHPGLAWSLHLHIWDEQSGCADGTAQKKLDF